MRVIFLAAALALATAAVVPSPDSSSLEDTPCCKTCTVSGQEKYYSIDKVHNMCGECCMFPKDYALFKIFEPGLTKATDNTPCADKEYTNYTSTVTHGFGPIKMTLDLYGPNANETKSTSTEPSPVSVPASVAVAVNPPPTVANFSAPAYMGEWYQLADYPQFYEFACNKCTRATYKLNADGSIAVDNESKGFIPCSIKGTATCPDSAHPGQCTVKFPVGKGGYWIVALGPLTSNQLYSWAIVSDETRSSLYLLSRERIISPQALADLKNKTASYGFDMSKLKDTDQTDAKCNTTSSFLDDVAALAVESGVGGDTTLYKISGAVCGQATLDSKYASYAEKFAGLKEGTCASQEYTIPDGNQTLNVPVIGKITVSKFLKNNTNY